MKAPVLDLNGTAILGAVFPVKVVERVAEIAEADGLGRCEWLRRLVVRHLEEADAAFAGGALA